MAGLASRVPATDHRGAGHLRRAQSPRDVEETTVKTQISSVKEPTCYLHCTGMYSLLPGVCLLVYSPRPLQALPKIPVSNPSIKPRSLWHRSLSDMRPNSTAAVPTLGTR